MKWALLLAAAILHAQPAAPRFEVASVKPAANTGESRGMHGGPGTSSPGRITYTGVSMRDLLFMAYRPQAYELDTAAWMNQDRYDIVARVPAGARREDVPAMLQALLAERFGLKIHRETKEAAGFVLSVGPGGAKLKESPEAPPSDPAARPQFGLGKEGFLTLPAGYSSIMVMPPKEGVSRASAGRTTMDEFCVWLSRQLQQPVGNETGLEGTFDFRLLFATEHFRDAPQAEPPGGRLEASEPAPTLPKAVEGQLGLKLIRKRLAIHPLVIDHVERIPVAN